MEGEPGAWRAIIGQAVSGALCGPWGRDDGMSLAESRRAGLTYAGTLPFSTVVLAT